MRRALRWLYRLAWHLVLPVVLAYLWRRGRRDPAYRRHWGERFGGGPVIAGAVWVHAVSLGEMRSAVPLVRALLDRGHGVVTTHLTPAGRRAAEAAFGPEIAAGQVLARYLPMELGWACRRFLRRARPPLGLVLEIEIWPVLIAEAARLGVPLVLANSQMPERSLPRERRIARWVGHPVARVPLVLAKSARHAARFRALGARDVRVAGELRFEQPIPEAHLWAAARLKVALGRPVVAFASVVAGEEAGYLAAIADLDAIVVWVPRAPELFGPTSELLAGTRMLRRTQALDARLGGSIEGADVLLGDSLGEMFFYLALADAVVVGGGFTPGGAHNVIEPLALGKPVVTGPATWSIEYPGVEAEAAGLLTVVQTPAELAPALRQLLARPAPDTSAFFGEHGGATARIMAAVAPWLGR